MRNLLFTNFILISLFGFTQESYQYEFIENQNQWHENVIYKSDINGGYVYFEKDGVTYDFFDTDDYDNFVHAHLEEKHDDENDKIRFHAYKVNFINANFSEIKPLLKNKMYYNYFLGSNPTKWASKVPSFNEINYTNIYNGIDLKYYSKDGYLKYDFIVKPNSKVNQIKLDYQGVESIQILNNRLITITSVNRVSEEKPYSYQIINGEEIEIKCNYMLKGNIVSFEFPDGYNKDYELIIDPTLMFSTYSGSFANNFGYTASFDSYGHLFAGGSVFGTGYPTTIGAYDITYGGGTFAGNPHVDIGITKYDTSGTFRIYSTYLGGSNSELPHSLIANSNDELFIYGTTGSSNFPTTVGAYDNTFNGGTPANLQNGLGFQYNVGTDIFIAKLSNDGTSLLASTFIGGTANDGLNFTNSNTLRYNYADEVRGEIQIDNSDNVYVVSSTLSSDFPSTAGSFQPTYSGGESDGCIVKMDNNLSSIIWSSFIGGTFNDAGYSIAIDKNNNPVVVGGTNSNDFPTTPGVIYSTFQGGRSDGFITHISANGSNIINSTYFGSDAYDQTYFVELDDEDSVHVFAQTEKTGAYFIQNAGYSDIGSGQVITKMNSSLSNIEWSTVFGAGNGINLSPSAFLVDVCDKIYLSGWGGTTNQANIFNGLNNNAQLITGMPITPGAFQTTTDGSDFYIMVMESDASNIFYGSYFGGNISSEHVDGGTSRFDRKGRVYQSVCAGCGGNNDFPIEPNPGAVSPTNNSSCNNGVFKFDFNIPIVIADFDVPNTICIPDSVHLTNLSKNGLDFLWVFGDGDSSTLFEPVKFYDSAGTYNIKLVVTDSGTCNAIDSIEKQITILSNSSFDLVTDSICIGESKQIGLQNPDPSSSYQWTPATGLSIDTVANPFASPNSTTNYTILISNGTCTDTARQTVFVTNFSINAPIDTVICSDTFQRVVIANSSDIQTSFVWSSNQFFSDSLNINGSDSTTLSGNQNSTFYVKGLLNGCEQIDSTIIEIVTLQVSSTIDSICLGEMIQIGINPFNDSTITYNWTPSQTLTDSTISNPIATPSVNTNYEMILNYGVCSDSLSHQVFVTGFDMTVSPDTILCDANENVSFTASTNSSVDSYTWSDNSNFTNVLSSDSTIALTGFDFGAYYIKTEKNGCEKIDSINLDLFSSVINIISDTSICIGDTISISATQQSNYNIDFNWENDQNIISGDSTSSIIVSPSNDETFYVYASTSFGCFAIDSINVNVSQLPNENISAFSSSDTIISGSSVNLYTEPSGYIYNWTPSESLNDSTLQNPISEGLEKTTTFYVDLRDGNCSRSDSVTITTIDIVCGPPDLYIPNAFTPNKDGNNDMLYLRGNNIFEVNLKIYDRWGELMFETTDKSIGWDGTFKGKDCDPAVYVYYLEVTCFGQETYFEKGNITVLR